MLKRKIMLPPEHLYPADEWRIVEARYSDEFVGLTETVFSLGNGFVGVRGSLEEGRPALVPGTFVNGFHETWPTAAGCSPAAEGMSWSTSYRGPGRTCSPRPQASRSTPARRRRPRGASTSRSEPA